MQEVWKSFNLKSDGAGFFERFLSQNDSKWGFSSIFKNWLVEFFDFLCEVTATERLENDLWFFWVQNQCMELFWVYWMNLQWYKGLKLAQRIFFLFFFLVGNLVLRFVDKKRSRESFLSCITNQCIEYFSLFAWSYSSIKLENWVKLFWQNSWVILVKKAQKGFLDGFGIFWKTK